MQRASRFPAEIPRQNTGVPCQMPGAPRAGCLRAPGSRLPGPGGVPRPRGIPRQCIPRGPSAFPGTGPRLGGVNAVSRMPNPGYMSGGASLPIPDNTLMAGRMPRPRLGNEVGSVQRHGPMPATVGVPRPGTIPTYSNMSRPCIASGPSTIGRPNIVSGAGGLPRGVGIPRPGGIVTASTGVPGASIPTQAGGIVRPSSIYGVGTVPRACGIQGAAGMTKPVYSTAVPRPCTARANVIPGPGGESREATMVVPSSYSRPPVLPMAGPEQYSSMRPTFMSQPGTRACPTAPGSFIRPPSIQRPECVPRPGIPRPGIPRLGIPRPGLPRPQFSTGQPCKPRAVSPSHVPGSGVLNSSIDPQILSVGGGLGPQIPQERMLMEGHGVPMTYPCADNQYQRSPCSPANIPLHVSPDVGGEVVEGTYVVDESRVMSPLQASRMTPVAQMDDIDCNFPTVASPVFQHSVSPCHIQERSPDQNNRSQSPRTAHVEVAHQCRNISPSPPRPHQSPVSPCPKLSSPPVSPAEECISPTWTQSPPRFPDRSLASSRTPPWPRPMTRKKLQRQRHTTAHYSKVPIFTSPLYEKTPREHRIAYRMPATPASGASPSPTPLTSPSLPEFPSPNNPRSIEPMSSPCEANYGPSPSRRYPVGLSYDHQQPQMEGTVKLDQGRYVGFEAEVAPGTVTIDRSFDDYGAMGMDQGGLCPGSYDSGSPRGVPQYLLESDRSESDEDGFRTPSTAMLRYRPSHYRPRKPFSSRIKRQQETPLSRVPLKELPSLKGSGERIFPRQHWRKLTDIYEEIGDSLEQSYNEGVCAERATPPAPEEVPCPTAQGPPEGPPDAWSEEEREFSREVDSGDGRSTKSMTKVRTVTKQWNDPCFKYSTSTKNKETVEILLSPPAGGAVECPAGEEEEGLAGAVVDEEEGALVQVADECYRMAEDSAARAREAAEQASRMALEAERAASRASGACVGHEEERQVPKLSATQGEVEQICRLLEEEEREVDAAVDFERRDYQMRKQELAEEERGAEGGGGPPPCPRAAEGDGDDQGPSAEVLAAMMWAEECGAPLSSDPEKLFQLLFGRSSSSGAEGPSREFILEERALAGPEKLSRAQLRGSSQPPWFPGYHCAFPPCVDVQGRRDGVVVAAKSPSKVLYSAWLAMAPESFLPVC